VPNHCGGVMLCARPRDTPAIDDVLSAGLPDMTASRQLLARRRWGLGTPTGSTTESMTGIANRKPANHISSLQLPRSRHALGAQRPRCARPLSGEPSWHSVPRRASRHPRCGVGDGGRRGRCAPRCVSFIREQGIRASVGRRISTGVTDSARHLTSTPRTQSPIHRPAAT
jgi:hypothetical protein